MNVGLSNRLNLNGSSIAPPPTDRVELAAVESCRPPYRESLRRRASPSILRNLLQAPFAWVSRSMAFTWRPSFARRFHDPGIVGAHSATDSMWGQSACKSGIDDLRVDPNCRDPNPRLYSLFLAAVERFVRACEVAGCRRATAFSACGPPAPSRPEEFCPKSAADLRGD